MNDLPRCAINPETVAEKLAAAANLTEPAFAEQIQKQPRLVELLWFIQWQSMQPGGLEKFSLDVVEDFAPQFGPPVIHDQEAALTFEQREELWNILPGQSKSELIPAESWKNAGRLEDYYAADYPRPWCKTEETRFHAALLKISSQRFQRLFLEAARKNLSARMRSMCVDVAQWIVDAPWYCASLVSVLFEAMDLHAERVALQLARIKTSDLVFDRLDYAWSQKVLVRIEGDTRFGKTEAIKAWSAMYPGKARLISTPCSNWDRDLFKAIAESFGLRFSPATDSHAIRDRVEFIIKHSGLFLILDEAHFLLPPRFSGNTQPTRLDWVRTQIVDRNVPVALVTTPQAFGQRVAKFQKATGYNFSQFFGRIMLNLVLPNELDKDDLLAVARIQGADIAEKFHPFIVGRAMQSEGYLMAIKAICCRARFIAQRDSHPAVTFADVELAASEVMPTSSAPAAAAPIHRSEAPPTPRRQPIAIRRGCSGEPTPSTAPPLEMHSRETSPAFEPVNQRTLSPSALA